METRICKEMKEKFGSQRRYEKELRRLTGVYERKLLNRMERLDKFGYSLQTLRVIKRGSLAFKLVEKYLDIESVINDLKEHFDMYLGLIGLKNKMVEKFKILYKDGSYFIRPSCIKSRAVLTAYKSALQREISSNF